MFNKLVLRGQVTVHAHVDNVSFGGLDSEAEVNTSNNLGLGLEDRVKVQLSINQLQTSLGSFHDEGGSGGVLGFPSADQHLVSLNVGVDSLGLVEGLSLLGGETFGDRVLNTAQVSSTGHLEVSSISPGGVPGVGKEPVVLSLFSSPSNHLDAVATDLTARSRGVDTIGVEVKEVVKVVVDGEASLEGSVVHQFFLVVSQVLGTESRGKRLEGVSLVDSRPVLTVLAGIVVVTAARGGTVTREVGRASREALGSASGVATVANDPVPGSLGVSTVATLTRAVQDRFRGDDSARLGLTVDAKTISKRLNRAEIPAGTALFLVQDKPTALLPLSTRIKISRNTRTQSTSHQSSNNNNNLHHLFLSSFFFEERKITTRSKTKERNLTTMTA
mmetsp:Transcript_26420/g.41118  ORF Transcript_26420/g.41118 Transcript_26420/m.41118 type:complete len:388 (+) Transcript_26420:91-1254(+)